MLLSMLAAASMPDMGSMRMSIKGGRAGAADRDQWHLDHCGQLPTTVRFSLELTMVSKA